jgi:hypothetical protein
VTTTTDDLHAALRQLHAAAQDAGLKTSEHHAHGEQLVLFFSGERLLLTWRVKAKLAQRPDRSRPVRCASWPVALELALQVAKNQA